MNEPGGGALVVSGRCPRTCHGRFTTGTKTHDGHDVDWVEICHPSILSLWSFVIVVFVVSGALPVDVT